MQESGGIENTSSLPGNNVTADLISRSKTLPDWELKRKIATKIFKVFGRPQVDLMATSGQVPAFFSELVEKEAMVIDAFTENRSRSSVAYVFPPPQILPLIMNRIYQSSRKNSFIVITPWMPKYIY